MMTNNSIITFAINVSDLTLSRYLAAQGTNCLVIDIDARSYENNELLIQQIKEWCIGPSIIGISTDPEKLKVFEDRFVDIIWLEKDNFYNNSFQMQGMFYRFANSNGNANVVIQWINEPKEIKTISSIQAIAFDAGQEESTGIFDFDRLDEIFDHLSFDQS